MTLDPETINQVAEEAAKKAIHQFVRNDLGHCILCNDEEYWDKHRKDHEFVDELIEFLKRIQVVKWGSLKNLSSLILVALVSWLVLTLFGIKFP